MGHFISIYNPFLIFALNALWRNVDSKFFHPTKEKLYFRLFDREIFQTTLNFPHYICFAFFHLSLKKSSF